jgi:hypothetical protein
VKRRWVMAAMVAAPWAVLACDEKTPTSLDEGRLPVDPTTVEIVLSWAEFARGLEVYGGFGSTNELGAGVVAHGFAGTLDARTLVRFEPFPLRATVRDSLGTLRPDSNFTFVGGRVVARLDTLSSTNGDAPVTLALDALTEAWDVRTASWTLAVDTAGDTRAWGEPGAGPVLALGEVVWNPTLGDSVSFEVDSATVALLGDTLNDARGVRLSLLTEGERVDVRQVTLRLDARPNVHRDTLVTLTAASRGLTFVYDPVPAPPPDGIRVGGTPAWRTVIDLDIPRVLNGPASLCAQVGCPFVLEPSRVNHASLVLTTSVVEPAAFQPTDTIRLDVRSVLAPDLLPKSPLGSSFLGVVGERVPPDAFRDQAGRQVSVPITSLVRILVDPDVEGLPSSQVALLSVLEPLSLAFASFVGPGADGAPVLRLIVTAADTVRLP